MSESVDLSLQLPDTSFIEGSTIDATVRATAERDITVEGGRVELIRTMTYRYGMEPVRQPDHHPRP